MKNKVIIIIPNYKEVLSEDEKLSLDTLIKVNQQMRLPIVEVTPLSMGQREGRLCFDNRYFQSIHTYSELLLTRKFWESFSEYEYILIYQLDCLIFKPNIIDWCNRGFDMIGAPWSEGYREDGDKLWAVGNGGFSLRRVSKILDFFRILGNPEVIQFQGHEDAFFSHVIPQQFPFLNFKVAPVEEAKYFSWETNIELMKKECQGKTPTGCHAFAKRDGKFFRSLLSD